MKSQRTPLDAPLKARMVRYYEAIGIEQGITASRALYNSSRVLCNSADDVDTLYGLPPRHCRKVVRRARLAHAGWC